MAESGQHDGSVDMAGLRYIAPSGTAGRCQRGPRVGPVRRVHGGRLGDDDAGPAGGAGWGQRSGDMVYILRLFDALIEKGDDKSSEWQFLVITRELPMQGKSGLADESTQIFKIEELLINVARHSLVPRHIPIRSPDEIKKILQIYSLKTPQQLPLIISTDPQARYLALRPGELVRIERPSPSAGTYVLYRCCH